MESNERCFIVFYIGKNDARLLTGHMDITTCEDSFLNRVLIIENIKTEHPGTTEIALTNIIELTQKDYETWEITR